MKKATELDMNRTVEELLEMPFCELLEGVKSDGKRVYRQTEKGLERANARTRGSSKRADP